MGQMMKLAREALKKYRMDLNEIKAERDYMLTGLSDSEIRVMRQELAKERG